MIKQFGFIFLVIIISVSVGLALDETSRCDIGGENCNFVWDVVNNSNKDQKIVSPCNVTVYDGTYTEVWSVLSDVTNTWHNVSMPVGTTFIDDWYHVERNCNDTISSFNFEVNTTLSNTVLNLNMSINGSNIGKQVWEYKVTGNITAEQALTGGDMFLFPVAMLMAALIYFYLAIKISGEFSYLQPLLFILGLIMVVSSFFVMADVSNIMGINDIKDMTLTMSMVNLIILFFVIVYTMVVTIFYYVKTMGMNKRKPR